jgi:hypothetical protein
MNIFPLFASACGLTPQADKRKGVFFILRSKSMIRPIRQAAGEHQAHPSVPACDERPGRPVKVTGIFENIFGQV